MYHVTNKINFISKTFYRNIIKNNQILDLTLLNKGRYKIKLETDFFFKVLSQAWDKKNWDKDQTSDLWIPCSDVPPLSHTLW